MMGANRIGMDRWSINGTIDVDDKMFAPSIVRSLVDDAGSKIGVGDFRPSRKGPFGRFKVTLWNAK